MSVDCSDLVTKDLVTKARSHLIALTAPKNKSFKAVSFSIKFGNSQLSHDLHFTEFVSLDSARTSALLYIRALSMILNPHRHKFKKKNEAEGSIFCATLC